MIQSNVARATSSEEIKAGLRQFILKQFPLARKQQVKDNDPLLESGMLDSQGVLEVVSFLESQFSLLLEDDELVPENFQTIERISSFVESKLDIA